MNPKGLITKKTSPHQALHEFILFAENQIPSLIHNVKMLKEKVPLDLKNPILIFLLNRTCNQVLEELVLRLCDGWKMFNREIRKLGTLAVLSDDDSDYQDLDTMRDKLIAHRVEAGISEKRDFAQWYFEKYGSYEEDILNAATHKHHRSPPRQNPCLPAGRVEWERLEFKKGWNPEAVMFGMRVNG